MDKRIIFAVAGAGKTTTIINKLSLEENSLIITYTENNFKNLKKKVIDKFGYLPENIKIYTYFNFLYSFCYRPFLTNRLKSKGINFNQELPEYSKRVKDTTSLYYRDKTHRLYHKRIAKLLVKTNLIENINNRLAKYFDNMFIDEIQDFGGHDFNLLNFLTQANININFVGDFFQHTFDTSKDGNVNQNLYNDLTTYIKRFDQMGLIIDTKSLGKSYRCSSTVCHFVKEKLGVNIESHNNNTTNISYLDEAIEIKEILENNSIIKLFYQNSNKYNCFSMNWGKSKGLDHYNDVCIVLNTTTLKKYRDDTLLDLPASTRNKLYVACTRCRRNLYLVDEKSVRHYKN
ncbi:MAG: AAA family ATPase [Aliarcobacter sp.]|nr:AAA family ATPase [Aliarcobacter sp.]